MSTLSSLLTAAAGPIAKRVLVSLGVGIVSYAALSAALSGALTLAKSYFAGMPSDLLNIAAMAGFFDAFSAVAGGMIAAVSIVSTTKLARLT